MKDLIILANQLKGKRDEKILAIENWASVQRKRGTNEYSLEDRKQVEKVSNKIEYNILN